MGLTRAVPLSKLQLTGDLIAGDSRDFVSSIGAWVASGANLAASFDTTAGHHYLGRGAMKLHTTSDSSASKVTLSIPGTFKLGKTYQFYLEVSHGAISVTTDIVEYAVTVGDSGAADTVGPMAMYFGGSAALGTFLLPAATNSPYLVNWAPTADRTSVTVVINRITHVSDTRDLWVQMCRVVEVQPGTSGLMWEGPLTGSGGSGWKQYLPANQGARVLVPSVSSFGPGLNLQGSAELSSEASDGLGNQTDVNLSDTQAYLYGRGGTAARRGPTGFDLQVGPDYLGLQAGERSVTELEIWPDGAYDVVLMDDNTNGGTKHWYTEDAAGSNKSALSLLHNIKVGTADPSAGGGVASAIGSVYLRNNSGVGETWQKTGAGATAWAILGGASLTNPMTTAGDIIVGGSAGVPTRLAKGTDSYVLTMDPTTHLPLWAASTAGFSNPMTTNGDIIVQAGGVPARLAVGGANTVLHGGSGPTYSAVVEGDLSTSDITTANVTSSKHGFAPKSPADATQFLNGATTPAYAAVKDSDLATTDVTTNNVSTSKHGFAPKAPNDATKYLDGTGAYSTPAGGGGGGTPSAAALIDAYNLFR